MAQAMLNFTDDSLDFLSECGFQHVSWSPVNNSITCQLDDTLSLVIYKRKQQISLTLRKQSQTMSLPYSILETFCDLKESIQLLASFLDGQSIKSTE